MTRLISPQADTMLWTTLLDTGMIRITQSGEESSSGVFSFQWNYTDDMDCTCVLSGKTKGASVRKGHTTLATIEIEHRAGLSHWVVRPFFVGMDNGKGNCHPSAFALSAVTAIMVAKNTITNSLLLKKDYDLQPQEDVIEFSGEPLVLAHRISPPWDKSDKHGGDLEAHITDLEVLFTRRLKAKGWRSDLNETLQKSPGYRKKFRDLVVELIKDGVI